MAQDNKQGEGNREKSGFSWTAEKQAVLDSYNRSDGKTKNSSSVFSNKNYTQAENRSGYKYDYPGDDGYVYDPDIYASSSRNRSGIYSDSVHSSAPQRRSVSGQQDIKRPQGGQKKSSAPMRNGQQTRRNVTKQDAHVQRDRTVRGAPVSPSHSEQRNAPLKQGGPKQRPQGAKKKSTKKKNSFVFASKLAKKKEAERNRRDAARRARSDSEYERERTQGSSADESRRKQMHKKKRSRKFYSVICVAATVIIALCAGLGYCVLYGLPIETINIEGSSIYSDSEILQAGKIEKGDNMLLVKSTKTSKRISKALPYIDAVEVNYEFPDTLKLTVTETADKIQIENSGKIITLDINGKVLSEAKKKLSKGLYRIKGLDKQEYVVGEVFVPEAKKDENGEELKITNKKKYEIARSIINAIESVGLKDCQIIDVNDLKRITISCGKSLTLYVDMNTPLEKRFAILKYGLETGGGNGINRYADMRYSDIVVFGNGESS